MLLEEGVCFDIYQYWLKETEILSRHHQVKGHVVWNLEAPADGHLSPPLGSLLSLSPIPSLLLSKRQRFSLAPRGFLASIQYLVFTP